MLRVVAVLLISFALVFVPDEAIAARIGVASVVKNDVSGSVGGQVRVINVGSGVFQNELIATGAASSTQLLFRDETSLTIGEHSRLTLDRFVYNPATRSGDVVVNALQGTFRFISGSAKPGGYTIKTPVATVGLRGTIVEGYIGIDGSLVFVVVESSAIVTTADGTTVTLEAGQFITVSSTGVIGGPSDWTGPTLDLDGGLQFILDSNEPDPNQWRDLNEALDSRDLDLKFPETEEPSPDKPKHRPPVHDRRPHKDRPKHVGRPPVRHKPPVHRPPVHHKPPPVDLPPVIDDLPPVESPNGLQRSDARLKRDVHHISTLENGIRLYSFRYLSDETRYVGVMAQDLVAEPAFRHAVKTMPNGYFGVDYGALGLKMTTLENWRDLGASAVHVSRGAAQPGVRTKQANGISTMAGEANR